MARTNAAIGGSVLAGPRGGRRQSRNEPDQLTGGEGFHTQHHHRQTADGRDQRAEMAKDDQSETGEDD
jgi:hypothetical protein